MTEKIVLPPVSISVLRNLGLAIEDGKDESEQRIMWGDETVDWINLACSRISGDGLNWLEEKPDLKP